MFKTLQWNHLSPAHLMTSLLWSVRVYTMESCGRSSKKWIGWLPQLSIWSWHPCEEASLHYFLFQLNLKELVQLKLSSFVFFFYFPPFAPTMFQNAIEMESIEASLEELSFQCLQFCQRSRFSIFLHSESTVDQLV